MLRNCHGHNLSKGNIIKIFYLGLNEITQEVLNAAFGGIFLYKTPNQAYQLLEDKVLLKLDWAKNQKTKTSLKKIVAFTDEGSSNTHTDKIMARMDEMTIKIDAQYKELQSRAKQPTPNLDDDDIPMSREEESKFMQTFPRNEHVNVVFTRSGKTYNPPENPNEEQNKTENPINFDSDDEDDEPTPQPKIQTQKPVKETPLPKPYKPKIPDESSAMIQNKVPPKLGDPESFLIPCNFNKTFSCNALADLGASINLMPYSLYAKLSLETLKPTKMRVRLADRSFQYPVGIAKICSLELTKESKSSIPSKEPFSKKIFFFEFNEFIAMAEDENFESESDTKEPPFKKITINTNYKIKTSLEEPPTDLELKPLPDNLEYVFLEEPSFLPVIISSQLSAQNKGKLVSVLKKHKEAFAWKTTNIPGICPSFCKHKI
ncbi:reverse transcriptase domain-containing protein [Tanacetum coccineum]